MARRRKVESIKWNMPTHVNTQTPSPTVLLVMFSSSVDVEKDGAKMVGSWEIEYFVGQSINYRCICANLCLGADPTEMPFLLPQCLCIPWLWQYLKTSANQKILCLMGGQGCLGMIISFTDLIAVFNLAMVFYTSVQFFLSSSFINTIVSWYISKM